MCEFRGALRAWPACARLRDPARKRSTSDTSRPRGRLKWRRVIEFGTCGFPRGRVSGASHAAYRVFCSRSTRSRSPVCYACAGRRKKPRRPGVRVTSLGISQHECRRNSTRGRAWGIPRKRALIGVGRVTSWLHGSAFGGDVSIAHRDEWACRKPPPWRCRKGKRKEKKKPRFQVYGPAGCGGHPVIWAKEALVSGMG